MDNKIVILLGNEKNINSVNVETHHKIEISNNVSEITEFTVNDAVDSTKQFNVEREKNSNYRIYGKIEYMSLLNGLKSSYSKLDDFFNSQKTGDIKDIINSFDFYLVAASMFSGDTYTPIDNTGGGNLISGSTIIDDTINLMRNFTVVANNDNFEIYNAGFNNNVYDDQTYGFSFNIDFDIDNLYDILGFPITEFFLYLQYKKKDNEIISYTSWSSTGSVTKLPLTTKILNIGDTIKVNDTTDAKINDIISYSKRNFLQTQVDTQKFYIKTPYVDETETSWLEWSYNPFISFRLRYFSDNLKYGNSGSTSHNIINSIPEYATKLDDNGNYVWRDISPQGYFDPLSGVGVNYPFFNGRIYLFKSIIFSVTPNLTDDNILSHQNTLDVFNEISYNRNAINVNVLPLTELDNIGKPCQ